MPSNKPLVGQAIGPITLATVDGREIVVGAQKDRWTMLLVYRGRHCPSCKKFLNKLNANLPAWTAQLDVVVVSSDTLAKALADRKEFGWEFTLGHGLSEAQMNTLGLYVSDLLSPDETDRRFAEPGALGFRPSGELMLVDISNGPSARSDLDELLDGMIFNIEHDRPTRGLVATL